MGVVPWLERLVALPTRTGNFAANDQGLDLIGDFLASRGLQVRRTVHDRYGSLVATVGATKEPTVLLAAHLDVVPAPEDLYRLRSVGGRLLGRGVFDMKGAIAAYLALIDEIAADLSHYDVGVLITTDEEIDGVGVQRFVAEGYRPRVVVLPDGGDNWQLEEVAKGAWRVWVSVTGTAAHGARPWEGESATDTLLALLADVRRRFPDAVPRGDTVTIARLEGGEATNQVAGAARAALDIRVMGPDEFLAAQHDVTEVCRRYGATIEMIDLVPPLRHDLTDPLLAAFAASVECVVGVPCGGTISFGSSDASYFADVGIPCAVTRPVGGALHSDDEWVDAASLELLVPVLRDYLDRVART